MRPSNHNRDAQSAEAAPRRNSASRSQNNNYQSAHARDYRCRNSSPSGIGPWFGGVYLSKIICQELALRRIPFQYELPIALDYRGLRLEAGYRLDVLVAGRVVVEVKAIESIAPIHETQLLTYLRLSGRNVGLLMNFNVVVLKDGIRRRVLNLLD